MSDGSTIEWTDATSDPIRGMYEGQSRLHNGYAERFAERFRGVKGHPYEQGFDLVLVHERLLEPLRRTWSRRVFVNSMSDLFQDGVPDASVQRVFEVMCAANWHTYQVLTKRADPLLGQSSPKVPPEEPCLPTLVNFSLVSMASSPIYWKSFAHPAHPAHPYL